MTTKSSIRRVTSSVRPALRGHDHAHHERAEDQRDPDLLGHVRREQHAGEDRGDPAARHPPGLVVGVRDPGEQRPDSEAHHQTEGDRQRDRLDHVRCPSPATATAVASAIRNQAVTSSIAAHGECERPTGRLSMRRSTRIRASTGNAVIDIATPMNRAKRDELRCRAPPARRAAARRRSRASSAAPRWRSRSPRPGRSGP